ncbi:hypothetical protein J6590_019932 [Homalodisca vitripennis]|nr:hypothetical protein J6590_019932 [Homalodisca vitripennis]
MRQLFDVPNVLDTCRIMIGCTAECDPMRQLFDVPNVLDTCRIMIGCTAECDPMRQLFDVPNVLDTCRIMIGCTAECDPMRQLFDVPNVLDTCRIMIGCTAECDPMRQLFDVLNVLDTCRIMIGRLYCRVRSHETAVRCSQCFGHMSYHDWRILGVNNHGLITEGPPRPHAQEVHANDKETACTRNRRDCWAKEKNVYIGVGSSPGPMMDTERIEHVVDTLFRSHPLRDLTLHGAPVQGMALLLEGELKKAAITHRNKKTLKPDGISGDTAERNHNSLMVLLATLDIKNAFNSTRWIAMMEAFAKLFKIPEYLLRTVGKYVKNQMTNVGERAQAELLRVPF